MSVSTNSLNDVSFDSFFQEKIVDNNGVSVTDINLGLVNLFKNFNEQADNFTEVDIVYDKSVTALPPFSS